MIALVLEMFTCYFWISSAEETVRGEAVAERPKSAVSFPEHFVVHCTVNLVLRGPPSLGGEQSKS